MAVRPGSPTRVDYEYTRNGVANLFMMFAPLEGYAASRSPDRRTAIDYAHVLRDLADGHFARAKTITLVQDTLNTHAAASLYEAFPAAEARRLAADLDWHYTPKHGSLAGRRGRIRTRRPSASQCLDRRILDKQTIIDQVAAWVRERNKNHADAGVALRCPTTPASNWKSLYPSL